MDIKTIGIDVSKTTLEVDALPEHFRRQHSNDEAGIAALQADLLAQHGQMAINHHSAPYKEPGERGGKRKAVSPEPKPLPSNGIQSVDNRMQMVYS